MPGKVCSLILFLFVMLVSAQASAEGNGPLRIARIPMIVQSGYHLSQETVDKLEVKLDRALHIPLNGVLHRVEYLPEEKCVAALEDVLGELRREGRRVKLKDAMKPLAERLGADLVVCPVIEYYSQYVYMGGFWRSGTILHSNVGIALMGYEGRTGKPFSESESRFYHSDYSTWGLAEVLAGECMDKVIDRTGVHYMARGEDRNS